MGEELEPSRSIIHPGRSRLPGWSLALLIGCGGAQIASEEPAVQQAQHGFSAAHDAEVRRCYGEALRTRPELKVHLLARFIGKGGNILLASAPVPEAPELESCLEQSMAGWTLPGASEVDPQSLSIGTMRLDLGEPAPPPPPPAALSASLAELEERTRVLVREALERGLLSPADWLVQETLGPTASAHAPTAAAALARMPPRHPPFRPALLHLVNPRPEQRKARLAFWRERAPRDYVYVLDEHHMVRRTSDMSLRVEVRGGRVTSTVSLLYGLNTQAPHAPTMDELFERAEQAAHSGPGGTVHRFEASYEKSLGYIVSMAADARADMADDESSFALSCFSSDPEGCRAIPLTPAQCEGAGGAWHEPLFACERGGFSIGLGEDGRVCCRPYSHGDHDDMSEAACQAAGGEERGCEPGELTIGSSIPRQTSCCRRFID